MRRLVFAAVLLLAARADAQFQLERYEPSPAGSWFFGVNHPWYTSTRHLALGLTFDYGHDPLRGGVRDPQGRFVDTVSVVHHQLLVHLDLAFSFLDRVQISASMPFVLLERGEPAFGVQPIAGAAVGDLRVAMLIRLFGQPDRQPFSLHLGGAAWVQTGDEGRHAGDRHARGLVQLIAAGLAAGHLRWAVNAGVVIRPTASLGYAGGAGNLVGNALVLSGAIAYAHPRLGLNIGPELLLDTTFADGKIFKKGYTALDVLLGINWNVARTLQLGVAGGWGALRQVGTPDFRAILRLAYAPIAGPRRAAPRPLPPPPPGPPPPPDRDHDGVPDYEDECPDQQQTSEPDPNHPGCPMRDGDEDGVVDLVDLCPDVKAGDRPDPARLGCPLPDRDGDGVPDPEDRCPDEHEGLHPDMRRPGCPATDKDQDGIFGAEDACPELPGVASEDPAKNGCPEVKKGTTLTLRSIHFATGKATILPDSHTVLDEVARTLAASPEVKRLAVEGHTDDVGSARMNLRLSRRRAESVKRYLLKKGVPQKLETRGFGEARPLSTEKTEEARAFNRRVELRVLDR